MRGRIRYDLKCLTYWTMFILMSIYVRQMTLGGSNKGIKNKVEIKKNITLSGQKLPPELTGKFRSPSKEEWNIFFLDTTCLNKQGSDDLENTKRIELSARQVCAMESAVRANPDAAVYLLNTCRMDDGLLAASKEFVKEVFWHHNVFGYHVDVVEFLKGTHMEGWHDRIRYSSSEYLLENGSDILRLMVLWKFGGIALDLDFVVFKSLRELGTNFVGLLTPHVVGTHVLAFAAGHELAYVWLWKLKQHYLAMGFIEANEDFPTSVMLAYCNAQVIQIMLHCVDVKIYSPSYFYPLDYIDVRDIFSKSPESSKHVLKLESSSYMVKVWTHISSSMRLDNNLQGYSMLAEKYCPVTYQRSRADF